MLAVQLWYRYPKIIGRSRPGPLITTGSYHQSSPMLFLSPCLYDEPFIHMPDEVIFMNDFTRTKVIISSHDKSIISEKRAE